MKNTKQLNIRISDETYNRLRLHSFYSYTSITAIVTEAITQYLAKQEKPKGGKHDL